MAHQVPCRAPCPIASLPVGPIAARPLPRPPLQESKDHINLVLLGADTAGKSTACGRLLHDLGALDQQTMLKLERMPGDTIGASKFAWVRGRVAAAAAAAAMQLRSSRPRPPRPDPTTAPPPSP